MTDGLARSPFLANANLIEKERRADNSRQHKANGYDLFVTSQADGAPGLPKRNERETQGRKVSVAACGRGRTDRTMRLPPSVQPYSGGEASQAIGKVAREPREGEIPVELRQQPSVFASLIFSMNSTTRFSYYVTTKLKGVFYAKRET